MGLCAAAGDDASTSTACVTGLVQCPPPLPPPPPLPAATRRRRGCAIASVARCFGLWHSFRLTVVPTMAALCPLCPLLWPCRNCRRVCGFLASSTRRTTTCRPSDRLLRSLLRWRHRLRWLPSPLRHPPPPRRWRSPRWWRSPHRRRLGRRRLWGLLPRLCGPWRDAFQSSPRLSSAPHWRCRPRRPAGASRPHRRSR